MVKDELVSNQSIEELKNRLSNQKGINIHFDQIEMQIKKKFKKNLNKYISRSLYFKLI